MKNELHDSDKQFSNDQNQTAKNDQPIPSFATLDQEKKDDVNKDRDHLDLSLGGMGTSFDFAALKWPAILVGSWILVFIVEILTTSLDNNGLLKWPVVVGDMNQLGWLHTIADFINNVAAHNMIVGSVLNLGLFVGKIIVVILSAGLSGFLHMSIGHLTANIVSFVLLTAGLTILKFNGWQICWIWLRTSFLGIIVPYSIAQLLILLLGFAFKKGTFIYTLGHSDLVVLGASAGIFGLYGYLITVLLKTFMGSLKRQLFLLIAGIILFGIILQQFFTLSGLDLGTAVNATLFLAAMIHLGGLISGIVIAFRMPFN